MGLCWLTSWVGRSAGLLFWETRFRILLLVYCLLFIVRSKNLLFQKFWIKTKLSQRALLLNVFFLYIKYNLHSNLGREGQEEARLTSLAAPTLGGGFNFSFRTRWFFFYLSQTKTLSISTFERYNCVLLWNILLLSLIKYKCLLLFVTNAMWSVSNVLFCWYLQFCGLCISTPTTDYI